MMLTRKQFKQIMDLKDVDWSEVATHVKQACAVKCHLILDRLPTMTAIEGVSNIVGAKFLIEQRVIEALDALDASISDMHRDDLLVSRFLDGEVLPSAVPIASTLRD